MARQLYLIYLLLFVGLVQPQLLSSLPSCANTCYTNATSSSSCNISDYKCFCQSSTFHENFICCVRAQCDSITAETVGSGSVLLCAEYGIAITALPASACSSTMRVSSTATATSTQLPSTATSTISHDTITATATATQQANGNSNGDSNSALAASSTSGTYPLYSSSSSSSASRGSSRKSSELSTGAKAGIGAGVGGGVLVFLGVVIAFIWRNRNRNRNRNRPQPVSQVMPETSGQGYQRTSWVEYKSELDANQNHHQQFDHNPQVSKTAAYDSRPADPASVLSRPWNELHADPVYYHQLPTGENSSELP